MKNAIKIWLAAAALVMVAGCKVDSSEERYVNIVEEAYYVYCVTGDRVLSPVLSVLDRALKVDMYVRADQYGRYELEDMYFPEYKVRLYDDKCVLADGRGEFVFDGNSILDEGSVWECTFNGVAAAVSCTGPDEWDVDVDFQTTRLNASYSLNTMEMHVALADSCGYGYVYEVTVEGDYTEHTSSREGNTVVEVVFSTAEPTMAVLSRGPLFHFFNGGFDLHMDISGGMQRSEDIEVRLSPAMSGTEVTVNYMGETEFWRE